MITVIAKLPLQAGKSEETITQFKALMKEVATEPGTLLYSLNRKSSEPDTLIVVERYTDKAALAAHSATAHFKAFSAKLAGVLAGKPDITVLEELDVVIR